MLSIKFPVLDVNRVMSGKQQTTTHLQQRFREHVGNKWPLKSHFTECGISATEDDVSILGKPKRGEYRLLTLERLVIASNKLMKQWCYNWYPCYETVSKWT